MILKKAFIVGLLAKVITSVLDTVLLKWKMHYLASDFKGYRRWIGGPWYKIKHNGVIEGLYQKYWVCRTPNTQEQVIEYETYDTDEIEKVRQRIYKKQNK